VITLHENEDLVTVVRCLDKLINLTYLVMAQINI